MPCYSACHRHDGILDSGLIQGQIEHFLREGFEIPLLPRDVSAIFHSLQDDGQDLRGDGNEAVSACLCLCSACEISSRVIRVGSQFEKFRRAEAEIDHAEDGFRLESSCLSDPLDLDIRERISLRRGLSAYMEEGGQIHVVRNEMARETVFVR